MDISEEQQQQQTQYPYHQQPPPSSSYDPSQSQSYEAYYAYHHHHHHHQQQYYDPSSYPYYDYSSTQTYPPPTQIHHLPEHQPPAAAAMAALSQLSQLAGEMDAAEKSGMAYNPHYPYPHHYPMEHGHVSIQPGGGGGRRGGGPFRGGGRRGGGGGRGRGRGRGRGGGRKPHQSAPNSQPTPTAAVPTPAPPAPVLPVAWCDICRVECNSLEILEQHQNGKRHKKTAQRFEEIQKQQKLLAEYQAKTIPNTILPSAVTGNAVEVVEAKKVSAEPEIISMAAVFSTQVGEPVKASGTDDNNAAGSSSQVGEQIKVSATDDSNAQVDGASNPYNAETEQNSESKGTDIDGSTGLLGPNGYSRFGRKRGGGMKRKIMKYGRGGKRLKSFEPLPLRVFERPRVCTLCNAMCDSLVVFESHIAGKKHISKIKRCQGQGTVYGPITVYIPPNQPSAYPTQAQEPLFYGLTTHEMIQQATYMGMSSLQAENYALHQGVQGVHNCIVEGGVSEQQAMQGLETNGGKEVAVIDNTDPQDPANAPLVFESKKPNLSTAVTEVTNAEIGGALNITEYALPVSESDNHLGDEVLSGLDANVEQPTTAVEEINNAVEPSIQ